MLGTHRRVAALAVIAGVAALAVALGSERFGGLVPCALCLLERQPYRVLIGLGLVALVTPGWLARPLLMLAAFTALCAAALGFLHVGVEQGWWPSPLPECAAPRLAGGTIAERLARMPLAPSKPCDAPTYLIPPLPLSMALLNTLYALALAVILTISVLRLPRTGLMERAA